MKQPHWYIVGAGAIGCWCAYALAEQGYTVTLVFKDSSFAARFNQIGHLNVEFKGKTTPVQVNASSWQDIAVDSIKHAIVTTKSWQTSGALESLIPKLAANATVVLMQNGYGQLQAAQESLKNFAYFAASTTNGGYKKDLNTLCLAGIGSTHIGAYNENAKATHIELPIASIHSDIESVLWRKLCINAAINPLTAIHNMNNGQLPHIPSAVKSIRQLCHELAKLSTCRGFDYSADELFERVLSVCTITAHNSSSMREDILHQRPTEIHEINGFIIAAAKTYQIDCPQCESLFKAVIELEHAKS